MCLVILFSFLIYVCDCYNSPQSFLLQSCLMPLKQDRSNNEDWIVAEEAVFIQYENA